MAAGGARARAGLGLRGFDLAWGISFEQGVADRGYLDYGQGRGDPAQCSSLYEPHTPRYLPWVWTGSSLRTAPSTWSDAVPSCPVARARPREGREERARESSGLRAGFIHTLEWGVWGLRDYGACGGGAGAAGPAAAAAGGGGPGSRA